MVIFVSTLPDKKCKTLGEGKEVSDSSDAWKVPSDHRTTFFIAAVENPTFEDILAVVGPSQNECVYLHDEVRHVNKPLALNVKVCSTSAMWAVWRPIFCQSPYPHHDV